MTSVRTVPRSPVARRTDLIDLQRGRHAVLFGPQNIERTFGVRTLARIPMAGGARRDMLTGVVDADWIPGSDTLAVIRDPGASRPWTVEFPVGTTVHEARAAWSLRVSPDGSHVAFFEGPVMFDNAAEATIMVIDKAGQKSTLSRDWSGFGLAWAPSGREIWFTATRPSPQAATIEDLGSKNGTFVGDQRVEGSRSLGDGDIIGVGSVKLTLRIFQTPSSTKTERE